MLSVHLDGPTLAQVRLAASPASEAVAWLRLTVHGRRHAIYGDPGPVARLALRDPDVALVAKVLPPGSNGDYTLNLLTPKPWIGHAADVFDRQLQAMAETPTDTVTQQLCAGRFALGGMPVEVRAAMENGTFVRRATDGLLRFWRAVFAELWPAVRTTLETDLAGRATTIRTAGIGRMLATLHRDVAWTGSHLLIGSSAYQETVDLNGEELVLCPTIVGWPGVAVQCCDPSDATLVYPANGLVAARHASTNGLPKLVGSSRAAILHDLGVARSTHELSTRRKLSPATVSYHLGVLLRCGLVSRRRDRRVVLYHRTEQGDAVLGLQGSRP
ncbi:MAG TPA: DUF5937 family protein [Micromonospora sp.]